MTSQFLPMSENRWEKGGNILYPYLIMTRVRVWVRICLLSVECLQVQAWSFLEKKQPSLEIFQERSKL